MAQEYANSDLHLQRGPDGERKNRLLVCLQNVATTESIRSTYE